MVIKPIILFLILLFLSNISPRIIEFNTINFQPIYDICSTETFIINFNIYSSYSTKDYIHIKISSKTDRNQVIAILSNSDESCNNDRISVGIEEYNPINLFFKKEKSNYFTKYLCIKCKNDEQCKYDIDIESTQNCELNFGEKFSYYVTKQNTEMQFQLKNVGPVNSSKYNLWVKGQKIKQATFFGGEEIKKFEFGYIYTDHYNSRNYNGNYGMMIISEEGDFVTVGSIFLDEFESNTRILKINDIEIMSYLTGSSQEICFPIEKNNNFGNILKINGNIYTQKAITYFKKNGIKDESTIKTKKKGFIEDNILTDAFNQLDNITFCVSHLEQTINTGIIFSLQLTSNSNLNNEYNKFIYMPQFSGIFYSHILLEGEFAVFQGMKPTYSANEINYNMKTIKGFPNMAFYECNTFPNCNIDFNNLNFIENSHLSNRMAVYSFYLNETNIDYTPIHISQPLLIVGCLNGTKDNKGNNTIPNFCKFETIIFSNKDKINIVEKEAFSQYLLGDETDLYRINFENEVNLEKIYLDIIVFSGDVNFQIDTPNAEAHKYFLSNKIFYSIHVQTVYEKKIDFSVYAYKNSFYMVQYQYVKSIDDSKNTNIIESGINYIQSIFVGDNADLYKYFTIESLRLDSESPFLVNFYSQNCEFTVSRLISNNDEGKESEPDLVSIDINDNYGQMIIDKNDPYYLVNKYRFKVDITKDDNSVYNDKSCMIYVSGLELSNTITGKERSISVSEGVPQFYTFTSQYPSTKYAYHISDTNSAVIIQFNLIDKAPYKVIISFYHKQLLEREIYRNDQIYLNSEILKQKCIISNEVCTVNINIELENKEDNRQRRLETTIYQINGAPIYLEKNAVKQDILINSNYKYYYLDIGKNEMGDIVIDYKRSSGYIFAKIVKRENNMINKNADWRGIYTFPKLKEDSLKYETYIKKIIITSSDTEICDNGCYLLITVQSSLINENFGKSLIPYRITITPRIVPNNYYEENYLVPKIKMRVNEFVIGNLLTTSEKIYQYYQVTLPYESEFLFIDWQADQCSLFINIGEERPTKDKHHYVFKSIGYDTTFKLTKQQIINKEINQTITIPRNDSIRNVILTLGIWTNKIDSLYTSVYAFKIFMPPTYWDNEPLEIIHIRSDQKVQCDPFEYSDDIYMCVFAVIFDVGDVNNSLIVYPRAQKENVKYEFKGTNVLAEPIEKNNLEYIIYKLNHLGDKYSSKNGKKYIYLENINKTECLFFTVTLDQFTRIEVLSSTYKIKENQIFVPNPSSAQIFALGANTIHFNFETSQDLLINIVSVSGGGRFYWNTETEKEISYYLNGYEDRLTLTSGTNIKENELAHLIIESLNTVLLEDEDKSGFIFYITFYPRNHEYNIDQVKIGRSTEFNYREVKYPLDYFTKINNKGNIGISFTFYNYYMNKNEKLIYDKPMYKIWGTIISEEEIINIRFDKDYKPTKGNNEIYGVFDGAFGSLFFDSEYIINLNINNPILFFSVEMENGIDYNFNEIGVEVSILEEQNENDLDLFAAENVYYNGKLSSSTFKYKLKSDPKNPYMRVEFSSNNNLVKCTIVNDEDQNINTNLLEEFETIELNGRYLLTFKVPTHILDSSNTLFLVIYKDNDIIINPKLSNYIFKYMNGENKNSFFSFPQLNGNIEFSKKESNNTYYLSFYPIEHYDVNYYIKAIYNDTKINGENKNTIAISESQGYYVQIENPIFDGEDKMNITLNNIEKTIAYIKILAKANFGTKREFLLYKPLIIIEDEIIPVISYEEIKPSKDLIILQYNKKEQLYLGKASNAYKIQKYQLNFDAQEDIQEYINIELNSTEYLQNKIVYFSTTDQNGKNNRIQLTQSGTKNNTNVWIKKEQFEGKNNIYMVVECQIKEGERCNYFIKFSGNKYGLFTSFNFAYNYYVSKNNKQMLFRINKDLDLDISENKILTIFANGGKSIQLSLKNNFGDTFSQYDFRTGAAITTKLNRNSYFDLIVEANEGDYLSIGCKITSANGESYINAFKQNYYQLTGYIKKSLLKKECYLLPDNNNEKFYLMAIFYNNVAEINFKDKDFADIIYSNQTITNGYYIYIHHHEEPLNPLYKERKYICIGFPSSNNFLINDLPYSLQITSLSIDLPNYYSPQLSGYIYPRIIPKGSVAFFNGANLNSESEEVIYRMITTEGLPKMYMYKCPNYPLCDFSIDKKNEVIEINEINRMSTWSNKYFRKNISPIDAEQYIMIVKCEDLINSSTDKCKFQTSIYGNKDEILLLEGESFSQYILKGQKVSFIIDFSKEKNPTKIHIDNLVINGDIYIDLKNEILQEINCHKYYLSNKIFHNINLEENIGLKKVIVNIEAKINSYFIVEYKLITGSLLRDLDNDIYNGINDLVPISPDVVNNSKIIYLHNLKLLSDNFYYISFYSLNCILKIYKIIDGFEIPISSFGNYGQDIILNDYGEDIDMNCYHISVIETDTSQYEKNMCMLYVSGLEMTKEKESIAQKEILINNGIPQKIVFQQRLKKIKYIYPIPDKTKNIAIYFNVINPAIYSYSITYNHYDIGKKEFYQSNIHYIDELLMNDYCKEKDLCNIIISLYVNNEIGDFEPIIEVIIKQMDNIPYYLPKEIVKQDFIPPSSSLYLYTTLGQNDEGYITVNFARGSGLFYARIVEINEKGDYNPEWRQFKFPKTQDDSLQYEYYNKKIIFKSENTSKCKNGCYLLISLQSSGFNEQYIFLQFSITVSLTSKKSSKDFGSIIQIEPEQYVVGSLSNKDKINNKDMYEFYQIKIPYNADKIEFDWQSESAILLVNYGQKRATLDSHDFYYNNSHSIFEFPIRNANTFITIGVYTENYESQFGTVYSFRIHFSKTLNIYKINSDQKTLCKPDSIGNNEYRCLFMITYSELDFIYDLIIYSKSQSPSASTYMYGEFIENYIYDSFNYEKLSEKIPNENSKYNTKKEKIDFIFLTQSEPDKHLYVNVISDKSDIIEFISSFKTFDNELNPSSVQLFSINNFNKMTLKFQTTKSLIININSLYGDSKIYLEDEPNNEYILSGRDNGLSLFIPSNDEGKEAILIVEDMNYNLINNFVIKANENKIERPRLAFYLEYYLRSISLNFDEIKSEKTNEIVYKKADFPLYYYFKLNNLNKPFIIFFSFHDFILNNEMNSKLKSSDFIFKGGVINQKEVLNIKMSDKPNININNNPIIGKYDPSIQVGQIFLSSYDLQKYGILEKDKPNLYLLLDKQNNDIKYKKNIKLDLTIYQENNDIPVTEKIYQYGKILKKDEIKWYKLKVDNYTGDMLIQFSTNSKNIDFAINNVKNKYENSTYANTQIKRERGKIFITFNKPINKDFIYLNVFLKNDVKNIDLRINNYVFKYINSKDRKNFFEYPIIDNNSTINYIIKKNEQNKIDLNVEFNRIDNNNVDIIYSLKIAKKWELSKDEINCTIAFSESESSITQIYNKKNNKILMNMKNIEEDYSYIEVIAKIIDGPNIEYVAYDPIYKNNDNEGGKTDIDSSSPSDSDSNKNADLPNQSGSEKKVTWFIVIIGIILFIIIIILIIFILIYKFENKELIKKVNSISFVDNEEKEKEKEEYDLNHLIINDDE